MCSVTNHAELSLGGTMSLVRIAALVLVAVFVAGPALADPKADAKPHVVAADTAYKLGKFADALAEYSKAYEIFEAPGLLFNIGQCHRNLEQYDKAIFFYEGYLRAIPKAKNRALVEELIGESKTRLAKQHDDAAAAAAADTAKQNAQNAEAEAARLEAQRQADEAARERAVAEQQKIDAARKAREDARRGSGGHIYKKWWFWTAVAGVAAAAGGTAYYFSGDTTYVAPMGSLGNLDRR